MTAATTVANRPQVATPVSDLFARAEEAELIASYSDAFELRAATELLSGLPELPLLYHADESFVLPLNLDSIQRTIDPLFEAGRLQLITFHLPSCYASPRLEDGMFQPSGRPLEPDTMLAQAEANATALRRRYGEGLRIAVENNNYFPTGAYETVAEPAFITELVTRADLGLLLDLGHARISARHMNIGADVYIKGLPLDRVRQVHLSGYAIGDPLWRDAHEVLTDAQWREADELLQILPNARFVTIEYYKSTRLLIDQLVRLRHLISSPLEC